MKCSAESWVGIDPQARVDRLAAGPYISVSASGATCAAAMAG
jgi:hypothetical protein